MNIFIIFLKLLENYMSSDIYISFVLFFYVKCKYEFMLIVGFIMKEVEVIVF